jgi:hypothetical protein
VISGNHGHVLVVPLADLDSTVDKSYNIQGEADHSHVVTLTVAQLQEIKAKNTVQDASSVGGSIYFPAHSHLLTITCA